jgi:PqqD family protein of HPr-rel-A system
MNQECFRIPPSVSFQRWQGNDEWVLYHSGTGETMRLSDAAVAVLELLEEATSLDSTALASALNAMVDTPLSEKEIGAALHDLLGQLLRHECIERVTCD